MRRPRRFHQQPAPRTRPICTRSVPRPYSTPAAPRVITTCWPARSLVIRSSARAGRSSRQPRCLDFVQQQQLDSSSAYASHCRRPAHVERDATRLARRAQNPFDIVDFLLQQPSMRHERSRRDRCSALDRSFAPPRFDRVSPPGAPDDRCRYRYSQTRTPSLDTRLASSPYQPRTTQPHTHDPTPPNI